MEPLNARSMLDAATSAAARSDETAFVERRRRLTPRYCTRGRQPKGRPRLFADRDCRHRTRRRFRAAERGRHRRVCRLRHAARRLQLGLSRGDHRRRGRRRDLLPGRRHLPGAVVPRTAPADDADDLILVVRLPAVHRHLLFRKIRQRNIAALACRLLFPRPRCAGRRTPCAAFAGAQLGATGPARSPHHHRRLRPQRRGAGRGAESAGDSDIHVLGVFDDRNDSRALDTCAGARSSARSTTSSNSLAAPGSTSCCSRCRSRRRRASWRC